MSSKKINHESIEATLKIDDLDRHTVEVLEQARACPELISGVDLDIYNVEKGSSMRQFVEYRMGTLGRSGRALHGVEECTLKLERLQPDHPVSWVAKKVGNNILILIIDRELDSVIHAMSTASSSA
ncbi:hypothetical protein [Pseudomonas quasicaspiana]|uniref:hypothetical protein n=1 Tax=Pseudomonas quasicaspiana TaxID=2829821 RepID=UPI001E6265D2|nr:hypothetical protein [Pseudomonas quasicaspiana]MCD5976335.1 hypothetical protein [Pseudomonas quasicaspiana]